MITLTNQQNVFKCYYVTVNFFKSVNIWQSYKQERDCLVHFLCLLAVCWPGAQSA